MGEEAIRVEHISKKYILRNQQRESYTALRDVMTNSIKNFGNKLARKTATTQEEFYAIKDLSFSINKGERVGIIGRNGAGKSTLLKILSRITEPSEGRIMMDGRVASLLEVGTGFHPELSGRENIFLNGSILGMNKAEIKSKFDEIVAFAEVERFLDTPVKRYSSGMYVRLAFAVAAHLEPEILIVDEVLAVGDAEFQKKCLGKMQDVSNSGKTLLFVSHNMAAIQNLCTRAIWMKNGQLMSDGDVNTAVQNYLQSGGNELTTSLADRKDRSGNGAIRFLNAGIADLNGNTLSSMHSGMTNKIFIDLEANQEKVSNLYISIGLDDEYGQRITYFSNEVTGQVFNIDSKGIYRAEIQIPKVPLRAGQYTFTVFASSNGEIADWIQQAGTFYVEAGDFYNTGKVPPPGQGNIFIEHSFQLKSN